LQLASGDRVGAGFVAGVDHPNVGKPVLLGRRSSERWESRPAFDPGLRHGEIVLPIDGRSGSNQGGFPNVRTIDVRVETRPYMRSVFLRGQDVPTQLDRLPLMKPRIVRHASIIAAALAR
jgi:hypothetical protein